VGPGKFEHLLVGIGLTSVRDHPSAEYTAHDLYITRRDSRGDLRLSGDCAQGESEQNPNREQ
jgi:hypothetical protein